MKVQIRRVFNLAPFVGQYNTYEVQEELEFDETKINSKLIYAYLNHLAEETFLGYLLMCVDIKTEFTEEVIAKYKEHTKNRIRYYNKIFRLGE